MWLPLSDNQVLYLQAVNIEESIPLLLGLNIMQKHNLFIDFPNRTVTGNCFKWELHVNYYQGTVLISLLKMFSLNAQN